VSLREKIVQQIRASGPMPFSRYMEICLYDPDQGYYSRRVEQFGKAGDFYTSSDVHAVFGRLLARQFEEMWRTLGSPEKIEIAELGPGRGLFARDVLDWSEKKFPEFFRAVHYSLWERSEGLRERLKITLERQLVGGKVSFSDTRAGEGVRFWAPVIVFANEFFDALPVEVLSPRGELRIGEKDGRLVETWGPAASNDVEYLDRYSVHPEEGERVETARVARDYMGGLAAGIERGFLIAIDYGYTRAEQLAGRHRGTVVAYREHAVSAGLYEAPGEQDITAHVNFTALAAAGEQKGMQVQPPLTQAQFLMGIGEANQFADAFEECRLPQERAKVALQLKHLVTPAGMGENFHVLVASKGVAAERVGSLRGLSFGKRNKE
jgi:SAM-dependent MidA family methyltransferase